MNKEFLFNNNSAELKFKELIKNSLSLDINPATTNENIKDHIDYKITLNFDVKGLKRINRSGEHDENYHWLEIKNVHGKNGWCWGKADFFAFETIDYFIIVEKENLQNLIKDKVVKEYTTNKPPELYKLYTFRQIHQNFYKQHTNSPVLLPTFQNHFATFFL